MSKQLMYQGQPGTSSAIAVSGNSAVRAIDHAVVVNPTATTRWLSVWLVQDSDTAADDTIIYHEFAITNDGVPVVLSALINMAIPVNGEIHMAAEAAAALTVTVSGKS